MKSLAKKAALAVATLPAKAGVAEVAGRKAPTIVLVHGAFADGSTWNKVIPLLQAQGLHVVSVQNPLTSLADDVAATRRALDIQTGPVVLVGHSWGGAVITEAGNHDTVVSLVYVAAFAPDAGQSVADLGKDYPVPAGFGEIVADKAGFLTLSAKGVANYLAQDVPANEAALMHATQTPTNGHIFAETVSAAAWKTKPSYYIVAEEDHMLQPGLQNAMAKKIAATVVSLPVSHAPHLSQPTEVAQIILDAAEKAMK